MINIFESILNDITSRRLMSFMLYMQYISAICGSELGANIRYTKIDAFRIHMIESGLK